MEYLDFEVEIDEVRAGDYRVSVLQSPVGQARETTRFPFSQKELRNRLELFHQTLVRARGGRDVVPEGERAFESGQQAARELGRALSGALLAGQVGNLYAQSLTEAKRKPDRGLRLKLRTLTPELAGLPWELLLNPWKGNFVCLSNATPLIRYLPSHNPPEALAVRLPLRILGMVASPKDLPALDVGREKARIEEAIAEPRRRGLVDIVWLEGQTPQALLEALEEGGGGPWHIFHFIGHGGFHSQANEGYLALAEKDGRSFELPANRLSDLLGDHPTLRLAVLNACEGARGGGSDLFASTAATLVLRVPAVISMQHEISDTAAIELARELYRKLAMGYPVDGAVAEARKAVSIALPRSLEWGTPVLHMRSPDGMLFDINENPPSPPRPPRLEAVPQRVNFGNVQEGQEALAAITVRNGGGGTLSWSFETTGDFFTASRTGDGLRLTLSNRAGTHRGAVQISSNGGDAAIEVRARVRSLESVWSRVARPWTKLAPHGRRVVLTGASMVALAGAILWFRRQAPAPDTIAFERGPATLAPESEGRDTTRAVIVVETPGDTASRGETSGGARTITPERTVKPGRTVTTDFVAVRSVDDASGIVKLHYSLTRDRAVLGFYVEQFPPAAGGCKSDDRRDVHRQNRLISKGEDDLQFQMPTSPGGAGFLSFGVNLWTEKNGRANSLIKHFPQYEHHCRPST